MFLAFVLVFSVFGKQYPLAKKYPNTKTIEPEELFALQKADKVFIVDARGNAGHEIIHIDGAIVLHSSKMTKKDLVKKIPLNTDKTIVFYCAGPK